MNNEIICPEGNDGYTAVPNPNDCGSFYKCDWGNPIYFDCPEGLHFNAELQVCDWPANAGCDPNAAAS